MQDSKPSVNVDLELKKTPSPSKKRSREINDDGNEAQTFQG